MHCSHFRVGNNRVRFPLTLPSVFPKGTPAPSEKADKEQQSRGEAEEHAQI
jgi:hypothetical protein